MINRMIIPNLTRVTITLPEGIVREVDARTNNRSRFILTAVERELRRAERSELRRSLNNPHPESVELAEAGLQDWADSLPDEKVSDLIDMDAGRAVTWKPMVGWKSAKQPKSARTSNSKRLPEQR